jgi:hypothetical protein
MKSQSTLHGRIIKKYKIPKVEIDDINYKYEKVKKNLSSYGRRLAGRIDSELEFTNILESTTAFSTMTDCMSDYLKTLESFSVLCKGPHHMKILSCWMNDMVEGEYNPPHTHHNLRGWSTVLFLKIPPLTPIKKTWPHKIKDGQLGFINVDGISTNWFTPKVGDFYIFEAKHQHSVMPFKTRNKNDIRRSMSFNFITFAEEERWKIIEGVDGGNIVHAK